MSYDNYLYTLRDKKFESPNHFVDCVACIYSFPPEETLLINDVPDDKTRDYLIKDMLDEPTQHICLSCFKETKRKLYGSSINNK